MAEIGDEELMGIVPKKQQQETWQDIGYYVDSNGRRQFGIIPSNNNNNHERFIKVSIQS